MPQLYYTESPVATQAHSGISKKVQRISKNTHACKNGYGEKAQPRFRLYVT